MKMIIRFKIVAVLAVLAVVAATVPIAGSASAAPAPRARSLTCTGGEITSGTFSNITASGPCSIAEGAIVTVNGSITVRKNAMLDAQSEPSTITVRHNVTALRGSFLGLGCLPPSMVGNSAHACVTDPAGHSSITVNGSITALDAATVLINGVTVRGSITALGGGSEIPWSVKNNTVGRSIMLAGQTTNWVGVMVNQVDGNVTLLLIDVTDTDPGAKGAYVVQNQIRRNLSCFRVTPTVSGGFSPTSKNVVGGDVFGQCAAPV